MPPRFGEDWVTKLRARLAEVGPLAALFRNVGAAIESAKVIREAQRVDRYSQGLEQLIQLCRKMGDLGEQLRNRARQQNPRNDPESAPVIKELEKVCDETERLAQKVFGMSVDWTLEEYVGDQTGLSKHLNTAIETNDSDLEEALGGDLEVSLDEFLDEITRRRYDFRPTILRQRRKR